MVVLGIAFLVVRNRRGRKRPREAAADAPGA
jgi:hypothetical protein